MSDKQHPEQRDGEFYLGNIASNDTGRIGWRTLRLGLVARDKAGAPLKQLDGFDEYYPAFCQISEMQTKNVDTTPPFDYSSTKGVKNDRKH